MKNDRKNQAIALMTKRKDLRDLTLIQAYSFIDDFRQGDLIGLSNDEVAEINRKLIVCRYIMSIAPSGWMDGNGCGGKQIGATTNGGELAGIY